VGKVASKHIIINAKVFYEEPHIFLN